MSPPTSVGKPSPGSRERHLTSPVAASTQVKMVRPVMPYRWPSWYTGTTYVVRRTGPVHRDCTDTLPSGASTIRNIVDRSGWVLTNTRPSPAGTGTALATEMATGSPPCACSNTTRPVAGSIP